MTTKIIRWVWASELPSDRQCQFQVMLPDPERFLMKKAVVALAITLTTTVTACAPAMVWNKPGATTQDFNRDSYQCEKDMRQSAYFGGGISGAINAQEFQKRCMVAAGWSQQDPSQAVQVPYVDKTYPTYKPQPSDVRCKAPTRSEIFYARGAEACTEAGGTVVP